MFVHPVAEVMKAKLWLQNRTAAQIAKGKSKVLSVLS
jgi:hypothetical protein